jgi:hypothetical protein
VIQRNGAAARASAPHEGNGAIGDGKVAAMAVEAPAEARH